MLAVMGEREKGTPTSMQLLCCNTHQSEANHSVAKKKYFPDLLLLLCLSFLPQLKFLFVETNL